MKSIAILLCIIIQLEAKTVNLPDGRIFDIPEQEKYPYDLKEDSPASLDRLYIISEEQAEANLLCPKGYSIQEIIQELVVNESYNNLLPEGLLKVHSLQLRNLILDDDYKMSPCPTVYHCLGYQACTFEYDSDLCQREATAFFKSFLLLTVGCFRDGLFEVPEKFQRNNKLVLHLYYSNIQKDSEVDYSMANLSHIEIAEEEVFSGNCPSSDIAEQNRYFGNCSQESVSDTDMSMELWPILGKLQSETCRRKIIENSCAFQLNRFGLCIPPIFHNKNAKSDRIYNFYSLPDHEHNLSLEKYMTYLSKTNADLISTRLAFVVMTRRNVQGTISLLNSIYREYFLFVIHVDKDESSAREELASFIRKSYPEPNVYILPQERSFSTVVESYETVRAKLESFEEVLRHGIWDYVITLTEEDTTIRNVDDLAIALAPYRGLSFLPDIHLLNNSQEYMISCDGRLYKIPSVPYNSTNIDFQLYSSSQDGILSRNFIEYLVNEKERSDSINKRQFFLQSSASTARSYIPTILMHSPFKDSLRFSPFHVVNFFSEKVDNQKHFQIIHKDKQDGQGEKVPFSDHVSMLASISHASFFFRNDNHLLSTNALKFSADLRKGEYYEMLGRYLPTSILKILIENALAQFSERKKYSNVKLSLENVLNLQIIPSFVSQVEYCNDQRISSNLKVIEFNYWMEVLLYNANSRRQEKARIMLQQSMKSKTCYRNGIFRMISVSPWYSRENDSESFRWSAFEQNLPLPYFLSDVKGIFAEIFYTKDSFIQDGNLVTLKFSLVSPNNTVKCSQVVNVSHNEKGPSASTIDKEYFQETSPKSLLVTIPCSNMKPGLWKLFIGQKNSKKSKNFITPFYLVDLKNIEPQLSGIVSLWNLKSFAFITENLSYNFKKDEMNQKRDFFIYKDSLQKQKNAGAKGTILKNEMHGNLIDVKEINDENKNDYAFICGGGFTSSFAVFLSMIILFCGWKYRFHQRIVLYFIFMLCAITILQIVSMLLLCT